MRRMAAILGAVMLVGQALVLPAGATELTTGGGAARASVGSGFAVQRNPDLPAPGDSLTAGPLGDVKVELASAWWVGNVRHSKFKISNVGTGPAYDVKIWQQTWVQRLSPVDDDHVEKTTQLGDMPAGAFTYITMVCAPKAGWVCDFNRMKALTPGSDTNLANNDDIDDV